MSKTIRSIAFVFAAFFQILQFFNNSDGQIAEASIYFGQDPGDIRVEGRFAREARTNARNLAFLRQYAGTLGLADRITSLDLTGNAGEKIAFKKLMPGEYLADADIGGWSSNFSLAPIGNASARAHISWIESGRGILRLDDLLPQVGPASRSLRLEINLPAGWSLVTTEREVGKRVFVVEDSEKAVFVIHKDGLARKLANPTGFIDSAVFDSWQFGDDDVTAMANGIAAGYEEIFGSRPVSRAEIVMMRFPPNVGIGNWEADTRGNTIVILSSDMPFRSQSLQRLHEQLRHEIFHLWFPNGVNLRGTYDWFYEGFALYTSLKLGVAANRLSFDDFLASLAQAYDVERMQPAGMSLIDASKRRFGGANTSVYARGMLAAFLCDLAILDRSRGKSSVRDLLREIWRKYTGDRTAADGNEAALAVMRQRPELGPIIDRYITGADKLEWTANLRMAGIEPVADGPFTKLKVMASPGGRQKDLLDKLGYNNWRKLSERSK